MTKSISSFAKDLVTATWRVQKMLLTYNKLLHEEKGTDFDQSLMSEFVKLWYYIVRTVEFDLRKPDLRKNLDLRKIVATTD